jgi:hypothetical protein
MTSGGFCREQKAIIISPGNKMTIVVISRHFLLALVFCHFFHRTFLQRVCRAGGGVELYTKLLRVSVPWGYYVSARSLGSLVSVIEWRETALFFLDDKRNETGGTIGSD